MVKAGVSELQAEDVLPIQAAADGIGGLAIGEVFQKLQDDHQRQPPRSFGGLAMCGEHVR
jgi:hypothetical protein